MASVTAQGTAGFVSNGVYGGVVAVTDNLMSDTAVHHPNRNGFKLDIRHLTAVDNAETLTLGPGIVAVAWQPEDATDDDVRAVLTTQATGVVTFVATAASAGWLWILRNV